MCPGQPWISWIVQVGTADVVPGGSRDMQIDVQARLYWGSFSVVH
jgi:hypothetical protein